jgi:hypothetical protein
MCDLFNLPNNIWRTAHAPYSLFPAAITAHTMIAFDIISGEYLTGFNKALTGRLLAGESRRGGNNAKCD